MNITILTQAYNNKPYVERCIKSVLSQTYKDFQYLLIDNGSNDGSEKIIRDLSMTDTRIKLFRFDQNGSGRWFNALLENENGKYFMILDSDDWLEPDCLERLVNLAKTTNSDIITTGSYMHIEGTNQVTQKKIQQRLILDKNDLSVTFPYYHVFFRTMWGKLILTDIFKKISYITSEQANISYGSDTLYAFSCLHHANRICIDNSILHHYRIHQKSVSHQYDPRQSFSDLYLYNDAVDFLSPYGSISEDNQIFLHRVYANAVSDTLTNIVSSDLAPADRLEEYFKILERKVTKECYGRRDYEDIVNNKTKLFFEVFKAFSDIGEIPQKWHEIFTVYFPKCVSAISVQSMKLALTETTLFKYFINDDAAAVMEYVCDLLSRNKYSKQFDLPQILQALAQSNPLISSISDSGFLKKYSGIYLLLYQSKYGEALDRMTDVLLKEKVNNETFLQTYLNLAALSERVDEFIFGKIKTAGFYLSEKRLVECRETLDEISEMGVEDNEEISEIKAELNG